VRERYAVEGKWYSGIDLHKLWNAEILFGLAEGRSAAPGRR